MTDIVERLRAATVHADQVEASTAMLLAADEIERLRAALEEERERCELIVYRMKNDPRLDPEVIDNAAADIRKGPKP